MFNLNHNREIKSKSLELTFMMSFLMASIIMFVYGISGIIEHKSPHNLQSALTLMGGFIMYFEYHLMIILGALGSTFSIWYFKNL